MKWGLLAFILLALSNPAAARGRVHSDLPLFTGRLYQLWPHSFSDKDGWGCTSRIAFGDWKYVEPREEAEPDIEWVRLRNYGVFHCAVVEEWSYDREHLGQRGFKHSWFVELGRTQRGKSTLELWALQSGTVPGSEYLLLTRSAEPGLIKTFEVLPVDCPHEYQRKGAPIDVWGVNYCVINSAEELRSFARKMARRGPIGTLTYVDQVSKESEAGD